MGDIDQPKNLLTFQYKFIFEDGTTKVFNIKLDSTSLNFVNNKRNSSYPKWTRLAYCRCINCPLNIKIHRNCPIALNIVELYDCFNSLSSFNVAKIIISTPERVYLKKTSVQQGLCSLLGIYMVTSGCPIMDKLKPMVRFHLPFATVEETIFRSTSVYLLGQYFQSKKGNEADLELTKLKQFYVEIQKVNLGIVNRLRTVTKKDAFANAVVCLDAFAQELPWTIEEKLKDIEYIFDN